MKTIFSEKIKIVIYIILGFLLIVSSYLIILNINHYKSLSSTTIVSEIDNDYAKFKNNVNLIEKTINSKNGGDKLSLSLSKVLNSLKNDGVYRLIPKTKLTYRNLYELNDYFMEELINNGWISNIKSFKDSSEYEDTIMMLVNNSKYLNSVFTSNSLILYDSNLDNKIEDNYRFILSNYLMYSNIILDISNKLGGTNE